MADLAGTNLDPNVPENTGGFTVVPEGKYQVVIVGDRLVDTKAKDGKILELKVQIIDGEHRGSTVIDRLNIVNKSSIAQAIGQGQLKRICNLCNVQYPPANTTGLIGKQMQNNNSQNVVGYRQEQRCATSYTAQTEQVLGYTQIVVDAGGYKVTANTKRSVKVGDVVNVGVALTVQ